jgi:hypothetical protein
MEKLFMEIETPGVDLIIIIKDKVYYKSNS